jgi:hypothetical protein
MGVNSSRLGVVRTVPCGTFVFLCCLLALQLLQTRFLCPCTLGLCAGAASGFGSGGILPGPATPHMTGPARARMFSHLEMGMSNGG